MNTKKALEYTAYDLLMRFYEFKVMVPKVNEWNEEALRYNPPRLYRFLILKSLLRAFDIGDDLFQDFEERAFLKRRNDEDFELIYKDIKAYAIEHDNPSLTLKYENEKANMIFIEMIYRHFYKFSETFRGVLSFNNGWVETGIIHSRYVINKTNQVLSSIDKVKLKEIEDLLVFIIDPKNQMFTKTELIKNYNFPDVDLAEIDLEYT